MGGAGVEKKPSQGSERSSEGQDGFFSLDMEEEPSSNTQCTTNKFQQWNSAATFTSDAHFLRTPFHLIKGDAPPRLGDGVALRVVTTGGMTTDWPVFADRCLSLKALEAMCAYLNAAVLEAGEDRSATSDPRYSSNSTTLY